jgi:broad specificity phosphatase PhoE
MIKIYLARHGQDEDNAAGILNGQRDQSLTAKGVEQASEVAGKIVSSGLTFDVVYASPLQRAFKTAEVIAKATHSPAPIAEPLLIERDFGVMTGKPTASIAEVCAPDIIKTDTITYFLSPEGAETFPDLIARANILLSKIREAHTDGSVLCVTHGDMGKMIYAAYYQLPWQDVLTQFHFGNAELLLLSDDSPASEAHVFEIAQHNH